MISNNVMSRPRSGLLAIGESAFRYRRLLIIVPLLVVGLAIVKTLLEPKTYSAESRFMPQTQSRNPRALAGFAAQFGINMDPASASESPEFYAALIKTRDLLLQTARTPYDNNGRKEPLGSMLSQNEKFTDAQAVEVLERTVSTRPEPKTGMIVVRTIAPSPDLAVRVNHRLLELVSNFNLEKRKSNAAAERHFVEGRTREAQRELERAEDALESFLQRNRQYAGSPQLAMEAARLERRVQLRQDVYTSLAQAYEQARVDEVRNTPLITIVDRPDASVRREGASLPARIILGLLLGLMIAFGLALISEKLQHESEANPEAYERMRASIPRFIPIGHIMRAIGPSAVAGGNGN
jgi:uncharacterized protein involved in exopolysaccharide biosynthesis